jgi:hypothetical protein
MKFSVLTRYARFIIIRLELPLGTSNRKRKWQRRKEQSEENYIPSLTMMNNGDRRLVKWEELGS